MLPARWWAAEPMEKDAERRAYRCGLCFHNCLIPIGGKGWCGVRRGGETALESPFLGRFTSMAVDPMEKKPLYRFRPGSFIFSLGSVGCTMHCPFCQNHEIAQPKGAPRLVELSVPELLGKLRELGLSSVAFTYNEPTLQAEYILAAAPLLREAGIAVVLVTNGMMSDACLADLAPVVDAANVDLKTFSPTAYTRMGGDRERAQQSIRLLREAGAHVELTTLVVPGISDNPDEFAAEVEWIAELSPDIPLHLSRYFPAHKFTAPATDVELLRQFKAAAEARLRHVYLGNVR